MDFFFYCLHLGFDKKVYSLKAQIQLFVISVEDHPISYANIQNTEFSWLSISIINQQVNSYISCI